MHSFRRFLATELEGLRIAHSVEKIEYALFMILNNRHAQLYKMSEPQKQGELAEIVNNIITQNNKKLLDETSKLLSSHFERIEKSNVETNLLNNESLAQILQKINVLESAISEKKKSIKTTTPKQPTAAENGGEEAAATAAPASGKRPANKMAYFKNRMLMDVDYFNTIAKQVDSIFKGKSQEIENSPAVTAKKPSERKKAICGAYWTLISPGKELKPILDTIEKEYKELKNVVVSEQKQNVTAQLDKDKQSDDE